ncbi:hypothetical protein DFJ74DRAFT_249080 [Hyaloraphidium curvatum]|nr:hypothetical protein DFJ74DRAFT_249080 [Hyaloraphidium curvatum]
MFHTGASLLALLLLLAQSAPTVTAARGTAWAAGQPCCAGCSYANAVGCCCPRLRPRTVVVRRTQAVTRFTTRTVRRTLTVFASADSPPRPARLFGRDSSAETRSPAWETGPEYDLSDPPVADIAWDSPQDERRSDLSHLLVPRHACPPCPRGARVGPSSASGRPCCPARHTVTRTSTVRQTRVRTRTRTAVVTLTVLRAAGQEIRGFLFTDLDGDGRFDPGSDSARPGDALALFLLSPGKALAARNAVIGETITDAAGRFAFRTSLGPGATVGIARAAATLTVLWNATVAEDGTLPGTDGMVEVGVAPDSSTTRAGTTISTASSLAGQRSTTGATNHASLTTSVSETSTLVFATSNSFTSASTSATLTSSSSSATAVSSTPSESPTPSASSETATPSSTSASQTPPTTSDSLTLSSSSETPSLSTTSSETVTLSTTSETATPSSSSETPTSSTSSESCTLSSTSDSPTTSTTSASPTSSSASETLTSSTSSDSATSSATPSESWTATSTSETLSPSTTSESVTLSSTSLTSSTASDSLTSSTTSKTATSSTSSETPTSSATATPSYVGGFPVVIGSPNRHEFISSIAVAPDGGVVFGSVSHTVPVEIPPTEFRVGARTFLGPGYVGNATLPELLRAVGRLSPAGVPLWLADLTLAVDEVTPGELSVAADPHGNVLATRIYDEYGALARSFYERLDGAAGTMAAFRTFDGFLVRAARPHPSGRTVMCGVARGPGGAVEAFAFLWDSGAEGTAWFAFPQGDGLEMVSSQGCAADGDGNILLAITSASSSLVFNSSATLTRPAGADQATYVAKYSPDGAFLWATMLDPAANAYGGVLDAALVAADPSGNSYAFGTFFPSDPGNFEVPEAMGCYLVALDPAGGVQWRLTLPAGMWQSSVGLGCNVLAVSPSSYVYVGGAAGTSFAFGPDTVGEAQAWVGRLTPGGVPLNAVVGGNISDQLVPGCAEVGPGGDLYVAGTFSGSPVFAGAPLPNVGSGELRDGFVAKFDAELNLLTS